MNIKNNATQVEWNNTMKSKNLIGIVIALAMIVSMCTPMNTFADTKPATVTIKSAKATSDKKINVKWSKINGASGYEVYMAHPGKKYKKVKTTTSTSYTKTKLKAGKTYKFKVRAYTNAETKINGSFSKVKKAKTAKIKNVSGLKAKGMKKAVKVTWKRDKKAKGYIIYMATSKKGTYKKVKTVTKNSTVSYTKKSLTKGKTYYFQVKEYVKTKGKTYKSATSPIVEGTAKGDNGTAPTPYDDDYSYTSSPSPSKNGGVVKGPYGKYAEIEPNSRHSIPKVDVKLKIADTILVYTLDGTTPTLNNGKQITKSNGTVMIVHDKLNPVIKIRIFDAGKQVVQYDWIDGRLYYWDKGATQGDKGRWCALGNDGLIETVDKFTYNGDTLPSTVWTPETMSTWQMYYNIWLSQF